VEESDVVFAKRQLLVHCREAGIGYHPFETFADVEAALEEQVESRGSKVKSHGMKIAVAVEG